MSGALCGHVAVPDVDSMCSTDTFRCQTALPQCISLNWVCDGDEDCLNGEDEANCGMEWSVFPCIPLCTPSSVSLSYIIIEIFLHRKLNIFTPLFDCFCTILYEFYTIGFLCLLSEMELIFQAVRLFNKLLSRKLLSSFS